MDAITDYFVARYGACAMISENTPTSAPGDVPGNAQELIASELRDGADAFLSRFDVSGDPPLPEPEPERLDEMRDLEERIRAAIAARDAARSAAD